MDHLLSALKTWNKDTRLGVIEALGEIRDPRAVEPLIGLLGDKDNEVRWESALALGEIADPRAFGPLEGALRDPDRYVRYGSAIALEKMGWSPDSPGKLAFLLAGKQEWDALAFTGKDTIPALDIAAKDKDRSVRLMAIRSIGGDLGDPRVECLLEARELALRVAVLGHEEVGQRAWRGRRRASHIEDTEWCPLPGSELDYPVEEVHPHRLVAEQDAATGQNLKVGVDASVVRLGGDRCAGR